MLLVRTGGIFGVIVSLIVAGIFLFVVRPAIDDTTDRAFDTADRIIDGTDQRIEETRRQVEQATAGLDADGDHLAAESFAAVVGGIKAELGPDAELLDFTADPMGGNVKYRIGDRAAGYRFGTGFDGLEPVKVTLVGSGKLADNVFPIARLKDDAAPRLTAAVREKAGAGFEIQSMTLGITPVTGAVRWTVTGEGDGRGQVFTAKADATGLKRIS